MGKRKDQARMLTLMLCMSLMVACMASRKAFACTCGLLEDERAHMAAMSLRQAAEGSCGGETQLWVHVPRSEADADDAPLYESEPLGGEVSLESEVSLGNEVSLGSEVPRDRMSAAPQTDEQLRRSVTVPKSQGQALPLTADLRPAPSRLCALVLGGGLALSMGLRLQKEVQR